MREEYRQRGVFDARGEWTWSQWCCCLSDLTEEKDGEKDEMKGGRKRERERQGECWEGGRPRAPGREIPPPRLRGIIFGDNG